MGRTACGGGAAGWGTTIEEAAPWKCARRRRRRSEARGGGGGAGRARRGKGGLRPKERRAGRSRTVPRRRPVAPAPRPTERIRNGGAWEVAGRRSVCVGGGGTGPDGTGIEGAVNSLVKHSGHFYLLITVR